MQPVRYPSRDEAKRHLPELQVAMEAVGKRSRRGADALAWPAGLDRAILVGLPLRNGVRRSLLREGFMEGDNPLTVYEVVRVPNFSLNSMREALVAAHTFLSEYIEAFDDRPSRADVVALRVRKQVERLTPRESTIIEHRVLRRPPPTLLVLGATFGVSPSRIRALQARAESRISIAFGSELPFIADALNEELRHGADEGAVNRRIDGLLPNDLGRRPELVKGLFRQALIDEMGLSLNTRACPSTSTPSNDSTRCVRRSTSMRCRCRASSIRSNASGWSCRARWMMAVLYRTLSRQVFPNCTDRISHNAPVSSDAMSRVRHRVKPLRGSYASLRPSG